MTYPQPAVDNGCASVGASRGVRITNDAGQVDQDQVTVNRLEGEEVSWCSSGTKALIVFASPAGSPFQENIFHLPAGGSISSGPPKDGASGSYKYTVVGQCGINDPVVIVEP